MGTRKPFSPEFKREAVQLLESGSRSGSVIARELGIARNQLYKWQTELRARGGHRVSRPGGSQGADHRGGSAEARIGAGHRGARHFKKSSPVLCQGIVVRYRFMHAHHVCSRCEPMMQAPPLRCNPLLCASTPEGSTAT
jgi:hypothetical protein